MRRTFLNITSTLHQMLNPPHICYTACWLFTRSQLRNSFHKEPSDLRQNNIISFISASRNVDSKQLRKTTATQVTMATTKLSALFNSIL
ncbi:hypothetical protein DsansV1_C32g0222361 [Dioscorea sansibarensis]